MKDKKLLTLILASVVVAGLLGLSIYYNSSNSRGIDSLALEGEGIESGDKASINDGDELVVTLKGLDAYDSVRSDLYIFAKSLYEKYTGEDDPIIGFRIDTISNENDTVLITGRFGATSNLIEVSVKLLNKGKVKTSITDTKRNITIDESLPSNNIRNQFIGTLPLESTGYVIDYVEKERFFSINITDETTNADQLREIVRKGIGAENLDEEEIFVFSSSGPVINNDY